MEITDKNRIAISVPNGYFPVIPSMADLNASTPYVAGSRVVRIESQKGRFFSGNRAPLKK
jgi:hypothetical protein